MKLLHLSNRGCVTFIYNIALKPDLKLQISKVYNLLHFLNARKIERRIFIKVGNPKIFVAILYCCKKLTNSYILILLENHQKYLTLIFTTKIMMILVMKWIQIQEGIKIHEMDQNPCRDRNPGNGSKFTK